MAYNLKINNNGTYRKFVGWTVICPVEYNMKFIENFISKNNVLSSYFSALPSSSYHVTLYNIWCNFKKLLKPQQDYIDKEPVDDIKEQLEQQSRNVGWFNPENCMNKMFTKLHKHCEENKWNKNSLVINKVLFNGHTIRLTFKRSDNFDKVRKLRKDLIEVGEHNDNMSYLHMTLAYKFKDLTKEDTEKIKREIDVLNIILTDQPVVLSHGSLHYFTDMKKFIPFKP